MDGYCSMKSIAIILFGWCCATVGLAQGALLRYEGRVVDNTTGEALPYALIENITQQSGALSNADGYYQVQSIAGDSLRCAVMGYEVYRWVAEASVGYRVVRLQPVSVQLNEVTVVGKDMGFLADIIARTRRAFEADRRVAKAYLDLKTYYDDQQVELLEAYANAYQIDGRIDRIRYKAGRAALARFGDRLFTSMESSKAIVRMDAFAGHTDFPDTPMEMSAAQMRKAFVFRIQRQFTDAQGDSILVIGYRPREDDGRRCSGRIWINTDRRIFLKWTMEVEHANVYPFVPLFPGDRLENVFMKITQTFSHTAGTTAIEHVDFVYAMDYYSRNGREEFVRYPMRTRALLYLYDRDTQGFALSNFPPLDEDYSDYRKLSAMPYNDCFWRHNTEYVLSDSLQWNAHFFHDTTHITSADLFRGKPIDGRNLYRSSFVPWSPQRITLHEVAEDSVARRTIQSTRSALYNIAVHVYFDLLTCGDSLQVNALAIMDPFQTYYYLERDAASECFINMYFDLCEVLLRQWLRTMQQQHATEADYRKAFETFDQERIRYLDAFKKEVQRGENEKAMRKYNTMIVEELQIDNIALYSLYQTKQ